MKLKHLIIACLLFAVLICNTAYAQSDSDEDITEYTILHEYVDTIESSDESEIVPYSDSFTSCRLSFSSYDDYVHIYFSTGYSRSVSQIGMYNFKLQKKVWYGWKDVFSRSELSNSNASFCARGYDIVAEHGETYRLKGTHFVVIGGTLKTLSNTTPEYVYK